MNGKRIIIDPGHGGNDSGAVSQNVAEKDINLAIALHLAGELANKYDVKLTRCNDNFVDLLQRAKIANEFEADIFVSIHNNAASTGVAEGTETLYYPGSKNGERLARLVQDELLKKLQRKDRGIKPRDNLAVLNSTSMPAILVECGFLTNLTERKLLQDNGFQLLAAEAIFYGIKKYFEEG